MARAPAGSTTGRAEDLTRSASGLRPQARLFPIGYPLWDKRLGDAAYATMIFFMVAFAQPRARSIVIGGIAVAISLAIECFQLTGLPARSPRIVQIALGTTFAWHDVACYVVGAALATLIHSLLEPDA